MYSVKIPNKQKSLKLTKKILANKIEKTWSITIYKK